MFYDGSETFGERFIKFFVFLRLFFTHSDYSLVTIRLKMSWITFPSITLICYYGGTVATLCLQTRIDLQEDVLLMHRYIFFPFFGHNYSVLLLQY